MGTVTTKIRPRRITLMEIAPGRSLRVFRIVKSERSDDPSLLASLRSNYELRSRPRRFERRATVIDMGISVYLDLETARAMATRFRELGDFIARLELPAGRGFNFAHTGQPTHVTLWGRPEKLRERVVDVQWVVR